MTTAIITTCVRKPEYLETATLTLRSVRVGFPNARIIVRDNASVRYDEVRRRAAEIGALCVSSGERSSHHETFERAMMVPAKPEDSLVFLDSDLIFYASCEDWTFDTLLAGYRVPTHRSHYTKCETVERLHTSFLWAYPHHVQNDATLKELSSFDFAPFNPYRPQLVVTEGVPVFHDTCSQLYHVLGGTGFNTAQLDAYTHIFCGSSEDFAQRFLPEATFASMAEVHRLALEDPSALRGLHRQLTW